MPERPSPDREPRRLFDLRVIADLPVEGIEVSDESQTIADAYLAQTREKNTSEAALAETAWALRRSLQSKLVGIRATAASSGESRADGPFNPEFTQRLRRKLLQEDVDAGISLALYRALLPLTRATFERELARHDKEKKDINGTYEEFKDVERSLNDERTKLTSLLSEMFKRAGKDPEPIHLVRRTVLESRIADLEDLLEFIKKKNPDVAALIEYDTIRDYASQLRTTGFIWTKSRQRLLQDVLTGALTSRPVAALMGETGSGKTALARAASLELSSREPERTVGGDQEKFVRLLASPAIEEGRTYYEYGPLLRAMTGLSSSLDNPKDSKGGGIFFDDEFNTRPTSVQRQILKFVSECRPGRKVAVPGTPLVVEVEPGFLYLAAGNPPSERYDREEIGIETKREFAGNVLNVEYLEQTPDNPELYQVLLASLLDQQTSRLTAVTPEELEPVWLRDKTTGESTLDLDPTHGGFLWRFSQCWGELFKAFSKQDTILHKKHPADPKSKYHLPSFILDPGIVLSWIDQYKVSPSDRKRHFASYLTGKLETYLSQFAEDEQKTVREYLTYFGIPKTEEIEVTEGKGKKMVSKAMEVDKPQTTVLTPRDIGLLNPNVPRPKQEPSPQKFEGRVVIDPETGEAIGTEAIPEREPETFEAGELAPFQYDKNKAQEYGFSELKIEAHKEAQEIIDAIYARDPRFVTIHRAGSPDPDSTTTPPDVLTVDKYKLNKAALQAAWLNDCQNLPNTPEKSLWFFQALAEHRLSNTIDSDDSNNLTNPTKPHIPGFGQKAFLLAMDFKEFDWDNAQDKQNAITPQTQKILPTLFNTQDPTSISRDQINAALWADHENRIQSDTAKQVIRELLGTSANPDDFELRLLTPDEYQRAAATQGYGQKNLWTHMDGYYAHGDGHRSGLGGGFRAHGGAASVGYDLRGYRSQSMVVRVVLSRKL